MMHKKLSVVKWIQIGLFATAAILVISISPYFVGAGKFGITPIYIWLAANAGIHPFFIGIICLILTWLSLGIFSAKMNYRVLMLWNLVTTLAGLYWLASSKEYIISGFSTAFYIWCIVVFILVQGSCWFVGMKFKAPNDDAQLRAICTILITLNLCWGLMPYYGIR